MDFISLNFAFLSGFQTEPVLAWPLIWGWLILAVLLVAGACLRLRGLFRPGHIAGLFGLRLCALLLLLLLLLQPYRELRQPDREHFQVAVLADASASMKTKDIAGGGTRLDVVRKALAPPADSFLTRLTQQYRVKTFLFTETASPYYGQKFDLLPGRTALGDVLSQTLEQTVSPPLGAVVLLSDGNANFGLAPEAAAKLLQRQGIPVSCIGIGEQTESGDLAVRFVADRTTAIKGQPVTLVALVANSLRTEIKTTLDLQVPELPPQVRELAIPAQTPETRVEFTVTPVKTGLQIAALRLKPVAGDTDPGSDADYAVLNVQEPPRFRILYLGAHLDWEYKFLQLTAAASDQFTLTAIIKTGENSFYSTGLPEGAEKVQGFPETLRQFSDYEAILLDTRALPLLKPEALQALEAFVGSRGGGLLCYGPLEQVPPALRKLLPAAKSEAKTVKSPMALEINTALIFDHDQSQALSAAPGTFLLPANPVFFSSVLKAGARSVIGFRDAPDTLLSAQAYGSGRVACLGLENSWRWRMENTAGAERHAAFWHSLLVWLSSSAKPRVAVVGNGRKVNLGEALDLAVDVNTPGFAPADDATVTATVTAPSGTASRLKLELAGDESGRYSERFVPGEPGEHLVAYAIELTGEAMTQEARFLVRPGGVETQNPVYREKTLRDIARITGGRFWTCRDLDQIRRVPVSIKVPVKTVRQPWCENWLYLGLLLLVLGFDWYSRRRIGLK